MWKISKRVLWKGGLGLLLVLLIGLMFVPMAQSQQTKDQLLRIGLKYEDIKTLDPHRAVGSHDRVIVEMVFSGLLRFQPGNLSADAIEPDLAKSVPTPKILSDGRQQWVFNLKEGVMSHPYEGKLGYEVTSDDVVYSLRRAADPKRSAFSGDYAGMTFEALDRRTVRITLEKPLSPILFLPKVVNRAGGLIACKKPLEEKGDEWFKTHPIGTGPFMFMSYKPKEKIVLVANENYYRRNPHLAKVEIFYIPDLSARELAIQKGELDVIFGEKEQGWVEKMEKIPGIVMDVIPANEPLVVHFNMTKPPLNLLKVRQAITYALDRRKFIAFFGERISAPVFSVVPANFCVGGLTKEEVTGAGLLYEFDIAKAKELLAKAGYPAGFTLTVIASTNPNHMNAWLLMENQLKKIGITLILKSVDHPTFHTMIRQDLSPMVIYDGGRENADMFLTQYYHSNSIVVSGKKPITNFSHIGAVDADGDGKIDSIDDLIEAARVETVPESQVKLWKEAQIKLLKYLASYPLYYLNIPLARKPYVDWGYELKLIYDFPKPNENTRILPR